MLQRGRLDHRGGGDDAARCPGRRDAASTEPPRSSRRRARRVAGLLRLRLYASTGPPRSSRRRAKNEQYKAQAAAWLQRGRLGERGGGVQHLSIPGTSEMLQRGRLGERGGGMVPDPYQACDPKLQRGRLSERGGGVCTEEKVKKMLGLNEASVNEAESGERHDDTQCRQASTGPPRRTRRRTSLLLNATDSVGLQRAASVNEAEVRSPA